MLKTMFSVFAVVTFLCSAAVFYLVGSAEYTHPETFQKVAALTGAAWCFGGAFFLALFISLFGEEV